MVGWRQQLHQRSQHRRIRVRRQVGGRLLEAGAHLPRSPGDGEQVELVGGTPCGLRGAVGAGAARVRCALNIAKY
jgi:hypothetical protein